MRLDDFIESVTGMVAKWNGDPKLAKVKLAALYAEVRNSTAYELAEAVRQRDEAMKKLHKKYLTG